MPNTHFPYRLGIEQTVGIGTITKALTGNCYVFRYYSYKY